MTVAEPMSRPTSSPIPTRRALRRRRPLLACALLPLLAAACQAPPATSATPPAGGPGPGDETGTGSISFALRLAADIRIDTVQFDIAGPAAFRRTGAIDVARSATVSAVIDGLPVGAGYTISLIATDVAHRLTGCRGDAAFDVAARLTTPVDVHMTCTEGPIVTAAVPLSPSAMLALGAALLLLGTTTVAGRRRRAG